MPVSADAGGERTLSELTLWYLWMVNPGPIYYGAFGLWSGYVTCGRLAPVRVARARLPCLVES